MCEGGKVQALRRAQRDTDLGIFLNCHAEPAEALYIAGRSDPIRRSNAPQLFGERFGPSFGRTGSLSVTVQGRFGRLSVTLLGILQGIEVALRQAQRDIAGERAWQRGSLSAGSARHHFGDLYELSR